MRCLGIVNYDLGSATKLQARVCGVHYCIVLHVSMREIFSLISTH